MEDGVTKQDQQGKLNENTKLKKIRLRVKNIDRMNMRFFLLLLNSCHGRPDLIRPADLPPSPAHVRKYASSELFFLTVASSQLDSCLNVVNLGGSRSKIRGGDSASLSSKRRRLR